MWRPQHLPMQPSRHVGSLVAARIPPYVSAAHKGGKRGCGVISMGMLALVLVSGVVFGAGWCCSVMNATWHEGGIRTSAFRGWHGHGNSTSTCVHKGWLTYVELTTMHTDAYEYEYESITASGAIR